MTTKFALWNSWWRSWAEKYWHFRKLSQLARLAIWLSEKFFSGFHFFGKGIFFLFSFSFSFFCYSTKIKDWKTPKRIEGSRALNFPNFSSVFFFGEILRRRWFETKMTDTFGWNGFLPRKKEKRRRKSKKNRRKLQVCPSGSASEKWFQLIWFFAPGCRSCFFLQPKDTQQPGERMN